MNGVRVDLRSDTFTLPTEEMYAALRGAALGDDMYGEDPTVVELEELAARLTGKEAALLVSSGSQANLTALMSVCSPGDEVIIGANSDFYGAEQSSMSAIAGVLARPIRDEQGFLELGDIQSAIREPDIHAGVTRLICVENSHNKAGGIPIPFVRLAEIVDLAHSRGIRVHMDGARVFNAATALGVPVSEVVAGVDTVSFCLSKGLSCPVGSLVCGSQVTIDKARRARKLLGGAMRQSGWIAAPGLIGLTKGVARLGEDHARAERLAAGLATIPEISLKPGGPRTNMVYFRVPDGDGAGFAGQLGASGLLAFPQGGPDVRYAVHRMVDDKDVDLAVEITAHVARRCYGAKDRGGREFAVNGG